MSVVSDVREMIGEASAAFYTDQQVYDAINETQMDMWMGSKWLVTTATLTTTASAEFAAIPTDVMIPQYVEKDGRKWFPTTMARLEQWDPQWHAELPAQPQWFVLWDATTFRMGPKPDATYTFHVVGPAWPPTEVTSTSTDLTIPDLLYRAIVHRAAASIMEYTQPQLADVLAKEAKDLEHSWEMELRNAQSHNIWQLKPGNRMSNAQAGNIRSGRKFPWYWSQY